MLSLAIWILVRDDPVQKGYDSYATDISTSMHKPKSSILSDLPNVFRYKNAWIPILFLQDIPLWLLVVLFSIVGFASGAIVIGMAFVKESVPLALAGTVSGISNMGMEMGAMILQPAIGLVLDLRWDGLLENGTRIYDLNAFHMAFGVIIGLSILGTILITFSKETFCQQLHE